MLNKLLLLFICIATLFSAEEKIGQKYYLDACSKCHGTGVDVGIFLKKAEWAKIFSEDGKFLTIYHQDEEGTDEILQYIGSEKYKKEQTKMLKFIQEFAMDAENIPGCH